jgi:hypothetical protein
MYTEGMNIDDKYFYDLLRKEERYDNLLTLYQKQLVKAVEYQEEIRGLEHIVNTSVDNQKSKTKKVVK